MATEKEIKQALWEQEKVKETLATEGAKIIAAKLRMVARATLAKELKADPFTAAGEIIKARQLRHLIKTLLPRIIEGLVNYDPGAPDMQVAPKDKFSLLQWLRKKAGKD